MQYAKKFDCLDGLDAFVNFHRLETGLAFSSNAELKMAWIEVDEPTYLELQHADLLANHAQPENLAT